MRAEFKRNSTLLLLKAFAFASYSLGYEITQELLISFGKIQPRLARRRAEVVKKNFLMVRGNTEGWERTFINFWGLTTDTLYLPYMTAEEVLGRLESVENLEVFKWFKQKGRPLIVTTAHIGMPEMLANFASLLGFPGVAVAEVPSNEWYREFLKRREKFGMKIIPMGGSYPILLSAIKDGQFIYLVSDRDIKKKGIILDFGRGKKYFPTGFASLSVETKTPLAFGCGVPTGPKGKYRGYILGPYYPKDINDALEWFAQNLYEFVYKYTDMWFVFQDEWV